MLVRRITDFGFEIAATQASAFIQNININIALNGIPQKRGKLLP